MKLIIYRGVRMYTVPVPEWTGKEANEVMMQAYLIAAEKSARYLSRYTDRPFEECRVVIRHVSRLALMTRQVSIKVDW